MTALVFDTDAFLRARVSSVIHMPDGSGSTRDATWWPEPQFPPGATWWVTRAPFWQACPAVVDDYGTLVQVESRV